MHSRVEEDATLGPGGCRVHAGDGVCRFVDGGRLLEVSPRGARNIVTSVGRLEGCSIGIVANQPRFLGGVMDAEGARKAARQERRGVIRHGASLLLAFVGAYITMNAKDLAAAHSAMLAESYAVEHQSAGVAAGEGHVDEVIDPCDTRDRLAAALRALSGKRGRAIALRRAAT